MIDKYDVILLQIIKNNGNVDTLIKSGLEYSQIARRMNVLSEMNLISINESDQLVLTKEGIDKVKNYSQKNSQNPWIFPLNEYQVEQINEFDVYLPKKENFF